MLGPADKWRSLVVIHVLESGDDALIRELDMKEEIRDPGRRSATAVGESVVFEHGDEHRGRKGDFGVAETRAHFPDDVDNGFPWFLRAVRIVSDSLVSSCEVVLPSRIDIRRNAVVGSVVNQKAEVVIVSWVCIPVE